MPVVFLLQNDPLQQTFPDEHKPSECLSIHPAFLIVPIIYLEGRRKEPSELIAFRFSLIIDKSSYLCCLL